MKAFALTRPPGARFAEALAATPPDPPIDLALARAQHAAYREALAWLGADALALAPDDAHPDACFVEDTAVVAGELAVITHPGAPSRRGEVDAVATALARRLEVTRMTGPGTLDGGDCLRLGRTIYAGRSARTSADGVAQLAAAVAPRGYRVVPVTMPAGLLHLKCVCAPLGDDRVLLAEGTLPAEVFAGASVVWVPADEAYAANAVALGDRVVMSAGFPRTRDALARAGFQTRAVETTEVRKADGALTCLSIVVASPSAG